MPLYDYRCGHCGDFREFRPMRESDAPVACPVCGAACPRVISTPFLAGGDPGAPPRVQRYGQSGIRHSCGPGCTHVH
jgi:putative FmdB family regulatory protein